MIIIRKALGTYVPSVCAQTPRSGTLFSACNATKTQVNIPVALTTIADLRFLGGGGGMALQAAICRRQRLGFRVLAHTYQVSIF